MTVTDTPVVPDFIEFLELVYGVPVRVRQKDFTTVWLSLYPQVDRSLAGVRFAARLYGIEYECIKPVY